MKALVLHGPGRVAVESNWPVPGVKPGWARVRVAYAGICGSDLPRFGKTGAYHHPIVLGHEFSGVVETPAPGSGQFSGGERVAVLPIIPCGRCRGCRDNGPFHCEHYDFLGSRRDGGFAEFCAVPESNLFRMPEGVDLRCGAFIEPLAVALHVVRRSGFEAGQTALVMGAGTIGLLTALWLNALGAERVTVVDVREERLETAGRMGLTDTVQAGAGRLACAGEYHHGFEAAGAAAALLGAIESVARKGTVTVVGRDTADTIVPLESFEAFMRKELTLRGCWGYDMQGEHDLVSRLLAEGRFPLDPLISRIVPLADAPQAIAGLLDGSLAATKVLIALEEGA